MTIKELIVEISQYLGTETWILQVFLLVFASLMLDFFQRKILKRIEAKIQVTENLWDDALIHAAVRPVSLFIWIIGVSLAAELVANRTDALVFELIEPARHLGIIVVVGWFLIRLVSATESNYVADRERKGKPVDKTTVDAITKLLRISILITSGLVALQTLGVSISGVLAFGGVGGLAVGLAAKDLLANFFGGLTIYLDRPFSVGDWIRSPDKEIEGTVEHIGWRQTRIRKFDKRPIYVPNSTFTTITVENPSRMTHRRIYETIGVRYDDVDALPVIVAEIETMLREHPEIDSSQTLMVNFDSFAASSLDFFVYTFTKTTVWTEYHKVKQDVLFKIENIISQHGAEIAFPTSTIHLATNEIADKGE